jgi:putative hydroxymethylpyrimidine transport system substrate-binding protein
MRPLLLAIMLAVAGLCAPTLSGCGSSGGASSTASSGPASSPPAPRSAGLVLDFAPNAVHAGIYTALVRRFDVAAGVRLHVISPSASTDSIKLLEAGRIDFAILDIHDLALARARGADLVGIMAVVQRPLASVIAAPTVMRPRDLEGKTVGVTGAPSDAAVLNSVVGGNGGSPGRVHTVTIGFNAVADLLAGRVAGATAFWNDEGVTLRERRPGFHIFRVERYGAPAYPELVLCATAPFLHAHRALARDVVDALVRGYESTLANPAAGARALESRVPGLDPNLVRAQLAALLPAFRGPGGAVGVLDPGVLRAWARWEARFGIVQRPPNVDAMFEGALPARAG